MAAMTPDSFQRILDNLPHVVMRLQYSEPVWRVGYVNRAIERYGYSPAEFGEGGMTWNDLLHPDDRVVALTVADDYMKNGIDDFKLQYRIVTKGGASIYITEFSHVNRNPDGSQGGIDSYLVENMESASGSNLAIQRQLALNDILLTIQDARSEPEKAIQFILDRVGKLLDCSRALLFRDSPDHATCKVVYEWLNHGITSIKDLDYAVTYSTEMPEIYVALQDTGVLLVHAGEIPEKCREEFEAEGLVSSAIFAVYRSGDHYGFVCFDDCVIRRRWDDETADFLKVVANLLSNVVMTLESADYLKNYEEKIKTLAFRDHATGLPNFYPYSGDIGDAVLAAAAAKSPAYAVVATLHSLCDIRNRAGFKAASGVCTAVAGELAAELGRRLGERGALYRVAGSVFAALAQPGEAAAVHDFARWAAERGGRPWQTDAGEYACRLNVAAVPFGVQVTDPDRVADALDRAGVEASALAGLPLVIRAEEE